MPKYWWDTYENIKFKKDLLQFGKVRNKSLKVFFIKIIKLFKNWYW
jgi:hypothetical protein